MDHLPVPANPTLGVLKIPYLCTSLYDGASFAGYPARHGWELSVRRGSDVVPVEGSSGETARTTDSERVMTQNGEPATKEAAAEFLQTWLYFGLLSETLGSLWQPDMQLQFFVEDADGNKWLSTQVFEDIVVRWADKMAEIPIDTTPAEYREVILEESERFQKILELIQSVVLFTRHIEDTPLGPEQTLALMAMGLTLTTTCWTIYRHHFDGRNPEHLSSFEVGKSITRPYLEDHMRRMNWCPSDILRIMATSSSTVMWYYANLQPPRADKNQGVH
ncbi:hypothetical protein LTR09_012857 [Extremus antarcticus]|uniref:Uncharacterized protein n=1 Tax=Extremus antarcticus TaxID=702011 RepID=A0AAJ0D9L1_9PEZI|nr:hypothetical protein LTR09_012857 [Extremus antarcticus]